MTKEQYDKLTKYELVFNSAINAKYIRALDSHFAADFISVCHELCIHINTNCAACVLQAALTLGKLYFEYKDQNTEHRETPSSDTLIKENTKANKTIKTTRKASQKKSK